MFGTGWELSAKLNTHLKQCDTPQSPYSFPADAVPKLRDEQEIPAVSQDRVDTLAIAQLRVLPTNVAHLRCSASYYMAATIDLYLAFVNATYARLRYLK